jgi:hypothetical protein
MFDAPSCPTKEMITLLSFAVSVESINSFFLARQSVPERCSREISKRKYSLLGIEPCKRETARVGMQVAARVGIYYY